MSCSCPKLAIALVYVVLTTKFNFHKRWFNLRAILWMKTNSNYKTLYMNEMALFQRQDANQQSLFVHPVPHVHGPNMLDSNAGPSSFPPCIAPSSHPQLRILSNVNNPRMNPPTFNGAALNPEPFHPFEMNPPVISHPIVNQPAFNHPSSFIHHAANSVAFTGQQSQGQTLNPPNLYHPPLLEFTFVLEYMGERIGIQTDQPTRFQILHLCNIASSALHNGTPRLIIYSGQWWHLDGWAVSLESTVMLC